MQTAFSFTEIPALREFLQGLNDHHSVTLNYVKGALGILSLIQGARRTDGVRSSHDMYFFVFFLCL